MDNLEFWKIIDNSKKKCLFDTDKQLNFLRNYLNDLSIRETVDFQKYIHININIAYSSDLFVVSKLIFDNFISNDIFEYFICWLILQGSELYNVSIKQPQLLIEILETNLENYVDFSKLSSYSMIFGENSTKKLKNLPIDLKYSKFLNEDFLYVVSEIYEKKTGQDFYEIQNLDDKQIDKDSFYAELKILTQSKKWNNLIIVSNKAIEKFPDYEIGYLANSYANFNLNNFQSALSKVNKVINLKPNFEKAYLFRSQIYTKLADYQLAIDDLTLVINLFQKSNYYLKRAVLYILTERFKLAKNDLENSKNQNTSFLEQKSIDLQYKKTINLYISKLTKIESLFFTKHKKEEQILQTEITELKKGSYAINDLSKLTNKCGIYILHFYDNSFYVGQTKNILKRFLQHSKDKPYKKHLHPTHSLNNKIFDIILFKNFEKNRLNYEEQRLIKLLEEHKIQLRNIELTDEKFDTDFENYFSVENQKKWYLNNNVIEFNQNRYENKNLRKKYEKKYKLLKSKKYYSNLLKTLSIYFTNGIPEILKLENLYWTCACPVSKSAIIRIFAGVRETFTIIEKNNEIFYNICLLYETLEQKFGKNLINFPFTTFKIINKKYILNHQNRVIIEIKENEIIDFLQNETIIKSIKDYNLKALKESKVSRENFHCINLVDDLITNLKTIK